MASYPYRVVTGGSRQVLSTHKRLDTALKALARRRRERRREGRTCYDFIEAWDGRDWCRVDAS